MDLISLKALLHQTLKLSPQQIQSMELLQMNSQELLEYLARVVEENPVLEQEDPPSLRDAYSELKQKADWLDAGSSVSVSDGFSEGPDQENYGTRDRETESLSAFLKDQLERRHLSKAMLSLCQYLADMVDEDGFLDREDLAGLTALNIPGKMIYEALDQIQSLEPAGVGARDLSECLLLQMARLDSVPPYAREIASRFLTELGRNQPGRIAKALNCTHTEVETAAAFIQTLNPRPGGPYSPAEPTVYVRPDFFIAEIDGRWQAILNDYYLPRVSISDYYLRLMRSADEETKNYLRDKMQQARWVLSGLERRHVTLQRCADALLDAQQDFFTGQTPQLHPMTLLSLSESISVHPSTVSRAIRGKYLQCRQGTFPLRYFFSHAVGGENGPSAQAVRLAVARLIREEDPGRPLSDQKLSERLGADGITVARRTVAKYREAMGVPTAAARKRR